MTIAKTLLLRPGEEARRRRCPAFLAVPALMLGTALAYASGSVPILPTMQSFPDHAACRDALERTSRDERAKVTDGRTRNAEGVTREVQLETRGVIATGDSHASYDSRLWYHHGAPDAATGKLRISHTFQERQRACDAGTLTITGRDGFTQPTFE